MAKSSEIYEATLTEEQIDVFSEKAKEFLQKNKVAKNDCLRTALSVEEVLFNCLENFRGKKITLITGVKFFRPFVTVQVEGRPYNAYVSAEKENGFFGEAILKNLGLSPEYVYDDVNSYTFKAKKQKKGIFFKLIVAVISAVAVGLLGLLLPVTTRNLILGTVLTPLHETFLNILGCIAGPMIFLSVAWGIYGIGDAATLKRLGRRMLIGFIGGVYIAVIAGGIFALPFFTLKFSSKVSSGGQIYEIFKMIIGIIPKNIFSPFVEGNTLQIIFLAVVIGVAMLFLGRKTTAIARAVEEINHIVQFLIEFISQLVPYFIFIVIVSMIWSDTFSKLAGIGKLIVLIIASILLYALVFILITSAKNRVSPHLLCRKGISTFFIAFTTASSAAAFGTNSENCKKRFGISDTVTSFGLPLGMVTFKPTTALYFTILSLYFAESNKVSISLTWFILMFFCCGILAVATPPIPGGALTTYVVLFSMLNIPINSLAIALTCDVLIDFLVTGMDQFLIQFSLLNRAKKLGMVNEKTLKSEKQKGRVNLGGSQNG